MLDRSRFIGNFLDELMESRSSLEKLILKLKTDPTNPDELTKILRILHTLKGSSRMMNFLSIQRICHSLENVWKGYREGRYPLSNSLVRLVYYTNDIFQEINESILTKGIDEFEKLETYESICDKIFAGEPFNVEDLKIDPVQKNLTVESESKHMDGTIRIRVRQVDEIVKHVNMLLIKQLHLRKNLDLITGVEEKFESNTGDRRKGDRNQTLILLRDLKKMKSDMTEYLSDLENSTYELQEKIINLRMLPLELVVDGFPRMVDEISEELGKKVQLEIVGENTKLDKYILEKLKDPFLHILRNSLDHGIESPEERREKNKPEIARIYIHCKSDQNNITIHIGDDGRGLNYNKIRARALEMNLYSDKELDEISETSLHQFLFLPGFSTKSESSDLSGRGIGLNIVKSNIEEIKGKISVDSSPGEGSRFTISLPSSLSTVDGFFVVSSGNKFLIPSHFIRETLLIKESEKKKVLNKTMYSYRNQWIQIYDLSMILDLPGREESDESYLMIIDNMGEILGMCVDSTESYSTLVSKPLPKNLSRNRSIQGIVFDENYNVIPILFIPSIIHRFKVMRGIDRKKRFIKKMKVEKTVLVVDDSLNTREIEKFMLESANYVVSMAKDGIEGLEKLREKKFDLLITDINMPRMDGFTLVENMKKDTELKDIPIIMVSSIQDTASKERAVSIGVNEFIVKSTFDQNYMMSVVEQLIGKVK